MRYVARGGPSRRICLLRARRAVEHNGGPMRNSPPVGSIYSHSYAYKPRMPPGVVTENRAARAARRHKRQPESRRERQRMVLFMALLVGACIRPHLTRVHQQFNFFVGDHTFRIGGTTTLKRLAILTAPQTATVYNGFRVVRRTFSLFSCIQYFAEQGARTSWNPFRSSLHLRTR